MGNMNPFHSNKKPIAGVKGLTNKPGENNCFLNSAIQVNFSLKFQFRTLILKIASYSRYYGSWMHFEITFDY